MDWYEAVADLDGERVKVQVFAMRSMASGAAFHRAYLHATQQAFLEAHELGVSATSAGCSAGCATTTWLSGEEDPARLSPRGDGAVRGVPLALAVSRRVLHPGARATRRAAWKAKSATSGATTGAGAGGARSGGAERQLLAGCREDEARIIDGSRADGRRGAWLIERQHLLPLAAEGFDLAEVSFPLVDELGCVKVRTNAYSVPLLPGTTVEVKLLPRLRSRSGTRAAASPVTSAATAAISRCSIWSTTSTCWSASRAHWPERAAGAVAPSAGAGPPATTGSGRR